MKAIGTILLSAALLVAMVSAQSCTQETCGEGPVWATFSNDDCSGTPIYYQIQVTSEVCFDHRKMAVTDDQITYAYFESEDCNENYGFWTETHVFDICSANNERKRNDEQMMTAFQRRQASMKRGAANSLAFPSKLLLRNVNDTLPAPRSGFQYDSSVTVANTNWEQCYGADNCTLADGSPAKYYENYHGSPNCSDFQYSEMMPQFQPGTCYNLYNSSYVKISCISGNAFQTVHYANPSCSGTAHFYEQGQVICGPIGAYMGYCSGGVEPIYGEPINHVNADDPPSGNASSLYASVVTIFATILAIFAQ